MRRWSGPRPDPGSDALGRRLVPDLAALDAVRAEQLGTHRLAAEELHDADGHHADVRLAEAQAAPLARDVERFLAVVGGAVPGEVVVVVTADPLLVVREVGELRLAAITGADLVVVLAVRAVVVAKGLVAVDASSGGPLAAPPPEDERPGPVRAADVANENGPTP